MGHKERQPQMVAGEMTHLLPHVRYAQSVAAARQRAYTADRLLGWFDAAAIAQREFTLNAQ